MSNIAEAKYNIRLLEDFSEKISLIHAVHPLSKVLVTIFFLIAVVSFGRYEAANLLPLFLYPVILFSWADIPVWPILKRLLLVSPLVIGIGILNPIFDPETVTLLGIVLSKGWLTFISIMIKTFLAVTAALLLMATTGMNGIARALRMMGVPGLFVLQLLLTFRYIAVLTEEALRIVTAYSLKAPGHKGIKRRYWGSLAGRLLIRTMDRSQRIYQAMLLRGFDGEYRSGNNKPPALRDMLYILGWSLFFLLIRIYPIPSIIGNFISGG